MKTALLAFAFWILAPTAQANPFLHADHQRIVDGSGKPVILRGMGLGGWMLQEGYMLKAGGLPQYQIRQKISELIGPARTADFYKAWLDNDITKDDIDAMAAWGFNSIRLPMHYNLYTLPIEDEPVAGQDTWLTTGFDKTDDLVKWARANDMVVILDLHAAPGGQGNDLAISDRDASKPSLWDSPANQAKTVALWRKLAERYKDEPAIGAYDLLNEPNWGFQAVGNKNGCDETANAPLRDLYTRIITAIREVDQQHMIIVEGNCWGNNYKGLLPIQDSNLTLSFHKYWNNTSQDTIEQFLKLRSDYDVPLWNGESGENSNDWFARAVDLEEKNGIGWSWWPLKKIGFNNPEEINNTPGMAKIQAWWQDKGPKPAPKDAEAALMQLATHNVKFANTTIHRDVIDALFRASRDDSAVPYLPHVITAAGGSFPAAEYDMGRNGTAYSDTTPDNLYISTGGPRTKWNDGAAFRNDGVDIGWDGARYFVSQMQTGEWLHYTLTANTSGSYTLKLTPAGAFTVRLNGQQVETGKGLDLLKGRNVLVIEAAKGPLELSQITLTKTR